MTTRTDNIRIQASRALMTPQALADELPLKADDAHFVETSRREIAAILSGVDQRLIVIVGPCSVHDPKALMDFCQQLHEGCKPLRKQILPVLRVYFEKPRTVVGWKGLINDPDLDGSFRIDKGLRLARQVLRDVTRAQMAAATEFLDTTFGQYYTDLVSYGAIGARTVESQIHRELASGLSMPVGFKNGTSGDMSVAIDAIRSAREPHWFPSLDKAGAPAVLQSSGNPDSHLILRGGSETGPNYAPSFIKDATLQLRQHQLPESIIVDCSHGNSAKDPARQARVVDSVCEQIDGGEHAIRGVMLESHLVAGAQKVHDGVAATYGQSITDACLALDDTLVLLRQLAAAVSQR